MEETANTGLGEEMEADGTSADSSAAAGDNDKAAAPMTHNKCNQTPTNIMTICSIVTAVVATSTARARTTSA